MNIRNLNEAEKHYKYIKSRLSVPLSVPLSVLIPASIPLLVYKKINYNAELATIINKDSAITQQGLIKLLTNEYCHEGETLGYVIEQKGGAVYLPVPKFQSKIELNQTRKQFIAVIADNNDNCNDRDILHELGHVKQSLMGYDVGTNSDFLETHNVIVNENSFPALQPTDGNKNSCLKIGDDTTGHTYYRIKYDNKKISSISGDDKKLLRHFTFSRNHHNEMVREMKQEINSISQCISGREMIETSGKFDIKKDARPQCIKAMMEDFMMWGIQQQIDHEKKTLQPRSRSSSFTSTRGRRKQIFQNL